MMTVMIFGCDSCQTSVLSHLWRLAQGFSVAATMLQSLWRATWVRFQNDLATDGWVGKDILFPEDEEDLSF